MKNLESLKVLLMDVDGVLTAGDIEYDAQGLEMKTFHVLDGAGLKFLQQSGIQIGWITGRSSKPVQVRAKELSIELRDGVSKKLPVYEELIEKFGVQSDQVGYIGDDLPDLPVLQKVAFPFAVKNAVREVKDAAGYITENPGGKGAVREIAEHILKSQGRWEGILRSFHA